MKKSTNISAFYQKSADSQLYLGFLYFITMCHNTFFLLKRIKAQSKQHQTCGLITIVPSLVHEIPPLKITAKTKEVNICEGLHSHSKCFLGTAITLTYVCARVPFEDSTSLSPLSFTSIRVTVIGLSSLILAGYWAKCQGAALSFSWGGPPTPIWVRGQRPWKTAMVFL